jgi:hypothetical protein
VKNLNNIDDAANGLTDLATLGGASDPSGMIGSAPQGIRPFFADVQSGQTPNEVTPNEVRSALQVPHRVAEP